MNPMSRTLLLAALFVAGARAESGAGMMKDIVIVEACNGAPVVLDLALPAQLIPGWRYPIVLFVHGGGWSLGDKAGHHREVEALAGSGFFVAATVNYRLTSVPYAGDGTADYSQVGGTINDSVADVDCATRWLKSLAGAFPTVLSGKIGIVGHSAGGHLSMMQATRTGAGSVNVSVPWAGPSDTAYLGHPDPAVHPIKQVKPGMAPIFPVAAVDDPIVPFDQSTAMCSAALGAGSPCSVLPVAGGHAFAGTYETVWNWTVLQLIDWLYFK